MSLQLSCAMVGFGEAGETFASQANWDGVFRGFDLLPERRAKMAGCGMVSCEKAGDALGDADIVLSLVTADAALDAACEYARHLSPGALWCDMNSVAPDTKRQAATVINRAGGRYVDVAVMAPVRPAAMTVPLLLSGPDAEVAMGMLEALGFTNMTVAGEDVGRASAIKLCRSIMVKGLEALSDEMFAACEAAGVAQEVFASLDASEMHQGWAERTAYNRERMASHGKRRAVEMEEAAAMLTSLGVVPEMTRAAIARQRKAGEAAQ